MFDAVGHRIECDVLARVSDVQIDAGAVVQRADTGKADAMRRCHGGALAALATQVA